MAEIIETVIDEAPAFTATGTEYQLNQQECRRQIAVVLREVGASEYADKCFAWFASRPEKFTFIVRGETYPTPILKSDGRRLYGKVGYEVGREQFTDKPLFKNFPFDLVLAEL